MEFDNVVVKEAAGVCRCCLSEGCYKDLASEYFWMGEKEIYADMLLDCFDLSISQQRTGPNGMRRLICEVCITRLRDACNFKKQVVESEKRFVDQVLRGLYPNAEDVGESSMMLKSEMKTEPVKMDDDDNEEHIYEEYLDIDDDVIVYSETEDMKKEQLEDDLPLSTMTKARKRVKEIKLPKGIAIKKIKVSTKPTVKKETALAKKASTAAVRRDIESRAIAESKKRARELERDIMRKNAIAVLGSSTVMPFGWHQRTLTCFFCFDKFPTSNDLISHTNTEHKNDCIKRAVSRNLWNNDPIYVDASLMACKICNYRIESFNSLLQHLVEHGIEYSFNVKTCFLPCEFTNLGVNCTDCSLKLLTFGSLLSHWKKTHNADAEMILCAYCGKDFYNRQVLNAHVRSKHSVGAFSCKHCGKAFDTNWSRLRHVKQVHSIETNEKPVKVKCDFCDMTFSYKSTMTVHIRRVHFGEKNFDCEFCDAKFFNKKMLSMHLMKHKGVKDYRCCLCDTSYVKKWSLKKHLKAVHNENIDEIDWQGKAQEEQEFYKE